MEPTAPFPESRDRKGRTLFAALIFLVAGGLFLAPGFLPGRVLSGSAALYALPPWNANPPPEGVRLPLILLDQVDQHYPWLHLTAKTLRAGEWPWRNPHNGCGVPLLSNAQSSPFFPAHWPFLLLPTPVGYALVLLLRLWIAGFGMFLLVRRLGAGWTGGFVAGVLTEFCGFSGLWIHYPASGVIATLPWVLWTLEGWMEEGTARWWGGLALTLGATVLGGHPESAAHVAAIAAVAALARAAWGKARAAWPAKRILGRLTGAALAALVAAALSAAAWLPFLDYLSQSRSVTERAAFTRIPFRWQNPSLAQMVLLAFPYALGSQRGNPEDYYGPFFGVENFVEANIGYVGMAGLALAAFGWRRRPPGWGPPFLLGLALFTAGAAWKIWPVFNLLQAVPVLNLAGHSRLLGVTAYALAGLAGFGAHRLFAGGGVDTADGGARAFARGCVRLAVLLVVILAGGLLVLDLFREPIRRKVEQRVETLYRQDLGGVGHAHPLEYWIERVARYRTLAVKAYVAELLWAVGALAAAGLAATLAARSASPGGIPLVLILAVSAIELGRVSFGFLPAIPQEHFYPPSKIAAFLAAERGSPRVLVMGSYAFVPNTNLEYGFDDLRSYDAMDNARYVQFLRGTGLFVQHLWLTADDLKTLRRPALIDFLGVRFLVGPPGLEDSRWRQVREEEGLCVYENSRAFPRAFLVTQTRLATTGDAALEQVVAEGFDPAVEVVLEATDRIEPGSARSVAVPESAWEPPPSRPAPSEVSRVDEGPCRIRCRVEVPGGGAVLVLGEAWLRGWEARIDGAFAPVGCANAAFCAVEVPAGTHEVVMEYAPRGARLALGLSSAGLVLALAALLRSHRPPSA